MKQKKLNSNLHTVKVSRLSESGTLVQIELITFSQVEYDNFLKKSETNKFIKLDCSKIDSKEKGKLLNLYA